MVMRSGGAAPACGSSSSGSAAKGPAERSRYFPSTLQERSRYFPNADELIRTGSAAHARDRRREDEPQAAGGDGESGGGESGGGDGSSSDLAIVEWFVTFPNLILGLVLALAFTLAAVPSISWLVGDPNHQLSPPANFRLDDNLTRWGHAAELARDFGLAKGLPSRRATMQVDAHVHIHIRTYTYTHTHIYTCICTCHHAGAHPAGGGVARAAPDVRGEPERPR